MSHFLAKRFEFGDNWMLKTVYSVLGRIKRIFKRNGLHPLRLALLYEESKTTPIIPKYAPFLTFL